MNKLIYAFTFAICFTCSLAFSQSVKFLEKRATKFTETAAAQMQLNDDKKQLVYTSLLEKFMFFKENIHDGMSAQEKQEIYSQGYKNMVKKLKPMFSMDDIKKLQGIFTEIKKGENSNG